MARYDQFAGTYLLDLPVHNYTGSTLAEGVAGILDTTNTASSNLDPGVTLPASDAKTIGFLPSAIPAGKSGVVRVQGVSVAIPTVGVTFAPGDPLMSDSSGFVKAQTAGLYQCGIAWTGVTTAVATDRVLVLVERAKNA